MRAKSRHSASEKRNNLSSWLLSLPTILWLLCFFLIPYLIVIIYSFLTPDIYDVKFEFSLAAYRQVFTGGYLRPFFLSFKLAIYTTLGCLLLGFPVAYYIARANEKLKTPCSSSSSSRFGPTSSSASSPGASFWRIVES